MVLFSANQNDIDWICCYIIDCLSIETIFSGTQTLHAKMLRIPSAVCNGSRLVACATQPGFIARFSWLRLQSTKTTVGPSSANAASAFKRIPAEPQHPPSTQVSPVNEETSKATLQSPGIGSQPGSKPGKDLDCDPNAKKSGGGISVGRLVSNFVFAAITTSFVLITYALYDPKYRAEAIKNAPFLASVFDALPDIFGNKSAYANANAAGPTRPKTDIENPLNRKLLDVKNHHINSATASAFPVNKLIDGNSQNTVGTAPNQMTDSANVGKKKLVSDPTSPSTGEDTKSRGVELTKPDKLRPTSQSAFQSPPPPAATNATLNTKGAHETPEQLIRAQELRIEELEKQVRELSEFQRRDTDEFTMKFRQLSAEAIERARRKAQAEVIIDEKDLEEALRKQRDLLDGEFQKHILSLRESFEAELQRQLKRQVTVHSETMHEQLQKQEDELLHQFESNVRVELSRQRNEFDREVASSIARLRGVETAVSTRADAEKNFKQAQELWHACNILNQTFLAGDAAASASATMPFGNPKPLANAARAVNEAAHDHPFVRNVIQSIPPEALTRGTASEEELRDRFDRVRRIARRLAMVGDDVANASLFRYFLSYLQAILTVEPSWVNVAQTKQIQEGELTTLKILALSRKSLENGDIESATRLVNQLKGLPRLVAGDWLREARQYLETRQAISVLLAHAQAAGLGTVAHVTK